MDPRLDWGSWFAVSIPVSVISILLIWLLLIVSYRPSQSPDPQDGDLQVKPIRPTRESFSLKQYWVSFVCLVTIVLWCVEHLIEDYVGDMGIIAIIPIVAFFSTGVLRKVCRFFKLTYPHFLMNVLSGRFRTVHVVNCFPCDGRYCARKRCHVEWVAECDG